WTVSPRPLSWLTSKAGKTTRSNGTEAFPDGRGNRGHEVHSRARRGNLQPARHENPVRRAQLRLPANGEARLAQQPAPVLGRVFVVHGEEPEAAAQVLDRALLEHLAAPCQIGRKRLADPVVQKKET